MSTESRDFQYHHEKNKIKLLLYSRSFDQIERGKGLSLSAPSYP